MYSPQHYRNNDPALAFEVIKRHDFATLISQGEDGLLLSQLPFLLENNGTELYAHCARANPQWKHFTPGNSVTVLFQGPHAYISPAWYKPHPTNVPTWDYVTVQVTGQASLIENASESFALVKKMSEHHENRLGTGWQLPPDSEKNMAGLVRAIVSFKIKIEKLEAKYKLHQKKTAEEKSVLVRELRAQGGDSAELAKWIERFC